MSRKGVITKRVETVQTALSREQRPNRAVRLAEERMFRARPKLVRPTEVSAKSKTTRPITHHDPGNSSPRSATPHRPRPPRTTKAREPGSNASRPRNSLHVPRTNAPSDPGSNASRPAERFHRPNIIRSTTPTDRESVRPRPFRLGHNPIVRPIVPHDRPNAAVDPKPFLKPKLMFSSPA
ncbi:unnamed protein product [Microthlaspi erraticum]|uniref:Uncharacterized protein n=1 Tax=Microthlaspi erraticum TaxID=1685480 RepID=A0A6D2KXU2_9BRAS|nr:unnamed protein product [Microthlaspi erraticum]